VEKLKQGVVLITGTTSGVGLNTLKPLISSGWKVVAINRSNIRAQVAAANFLSQDDFNKISFLEIDLSDLKRVREGAREISIKFKDALKILICNAAVYKPRLKRPDRSVQGFENSMAVNHFGHFLLINLLINDLINSDKEINLKGKSILFTPRITILGTVTANYIEFGGKIPIPAPADLGDLAGFEKGFLSPISMANGKKFKPGKAYKDSKLCNMITVQELAKRYSPEKIICNSLYPGCVAKSKLFRNTPWFFRLLFPLFQKYITKGYVTEKLAGQRVATVATDSDLFQSGVHWSWGNRQKLVGKVFSQKLSKRIIDVELSQKTWDLSMKLVGLE